MILSHDNLDLSALIGSRLCHDLISPIGAISNGLELLQMSQTPSPELALIAESVENANARIRFFRVAFGMARAGQSISVGEIARILNDLSDGNRVKMQWAGPDAPDRTGLRKAFLAALCLESSLPLGGEVSLFFQHNSWSIYGKGKRVQITPALWAHLDPTLGTAATATAGDVQFALLAEFLKSDKDHAEVSFDETSGRIVF